MKNQRLNSKHPYLHCSTLNVQKKDMLKLNITTDILLYKNVAVL